MRVTTNQLYAQALNRITDLQRSTSDIQNQIATGRRIVTLGDDPVGAAAVLQVKERLQSVEQFDRNGGYAQQRLTHMDDVLASTGNVLQRVRDLTLQGRNEALGQSDRRAIATEIREQMDVLLELGNTRNASGEYIFAGASVTTRPFTRDAAGNVSYHGDQVVRRIQLSETRSIEEGFAGDEALFAIRNGNGTIVTRMPAGNTGTGQISDNVVTNGAVYQPHDFRISFTSATTFDVLNDTAGTTVLAAQTYSDGAAIAFGGMEITVFGAPAAGDEFFVRPSENQSIYTTVNDVALALERGFAEETSAARFGFDIDRSLEDLDMAMEQVARLRATAGARLNTIDTQRNVNEDLVVNLQTLRVKLEDVDLASAISILAQETTALQAAQAAFMQVQGLSLFNYL